ncbi:MAG: pantoate--beta-alanine ligase [Sandaracinaceae bacterium]
MEILREPAAFRDACDRARLSGHRVGLVPTMGALHPGHLSLVEAARARGATHIVVTIFVNPLQFGQGEDFDRYPRTVDQDLDACDRAGVDAVFTPIRAAMYPDGFQTTVEVGQLTAPLEGEHRQGHFRGVTTVVAKLFALTGPSVAVFGRKDYQQWKVLERMALDLDLPIEVVGAPTVREGDGLALSSRNRYLSPGERERALSLVEGLRRAWDAFAGGAREASVLREAARAPVEQETDRVDYVALRDPDTLAVVPAHVPDRVLVAAAAHVGGTRLIDNVVLGEDPRP